jgi:hypothetical protein
VSRTLQPGLQEGDDHRSGRRDWGHSPKSQIVVHVLLKFVLGRVALLLFRNDERCRHGRSEEAPGPALGLGPGAAGAPIAGAGPAIGGRRGRIPAAAGGCGGLPPGAPTPGGGIPGVACAGACGAGGVENGFVPPTRLLRQSSRTFTGPAAGSILPVAFARNSEHASNNSEWRTADILPAAPRMKPMLGGSLDHQPERLEASPNARGGTHHRA